MKEQHKTIAVLGAIVALSGVLAGNMALGFFDNDSHSANSLATSGFMTGHVTMTVMDADGNIKAYQQSDNIIVNQGEDCAIKHLFGNSSGSGTTNCGTTTSLAAGSFNAIAIGNGSSGLDSAAATDVKLVDEHAGQPGLYRQYDSNGPTYTAATASVPGKVILSNAFTLPTGASCNSGTSCTVNESGLFNQTQLTTEQAMHNTDAMFARQTFTAITINPGETLTVEWTVNVGGAGTLGGEPTSSQ